VSEDKDNKPKKLVPEEQELANALRTIANKYGKFNEDETGIWAGYTPAAENEVKGIGVACMNCVFYKHDENGKDVCEIISLEIEELGKCRFAVIPDGVVKPEKVFSKTPKLVQEQLKKKIDTMGGNYTEKSVKISDLTPTQDYLDLVKLDGAGSNNNPITVYQDGEGYKLVDGHHRCAYKVGAGKNIIMAKVYKDPIIATAGSKPAPKKDQIKGSDKNKEGSAATGKGVTFTPEITKALEKKVAEHNEKAKNGRKVTLAKLKAVYRRGAGAFSTSHRPDQNRNSWAMARVNAFLKLVRSGKPNNSKYVQDNDLLPKLHPRHSEASTMSPLLASVIIAALDDNSCPPATQDIAVNLENREKAIETAGYGPLNPKEPNEMFWKEKAQRWQLPVSDAKKSLCGNCVMFIRTPEVLDCIESGISAGDSGLKNAWDAAIDKAELGYCEAFDFKCAASRTCSAWVVGGPITEDK
jgi:hypothetical protein